MALGQEVTGNPLSPTYRGPHRQTHLLSWIYKASGFWTATKTPVFLFGPSESRHSASGCGLVEVSECFVCVPLTTLTSLTPILAALLVFVWSMPVWR